MTRFFQAFIDRLGEASSADELSKAMARFADALGLAKFAYIDFRRPEPHLPVYLTTYPREWVYRYVARRYEQIDPVVVQSRNSLLPFFWDQRILGGDATKEQRELFGEASQFGIQCGFNIPIHDGRGAALVAFASDRKPEDLKREIEAHRDTAHLASIYFHVHTRQKIEDAADVELPRLGPEEIACLQWIVHGKSTWDIGEALSMSHNVVVRHLGNAKRSLHARTLSQAVAKALYHRLIEY